MRNIFTIAFCTANTDSPGVKSRVYQAFYKNVLLLVCLFFFPLFYLHTEESAKTYLIFLKTAGLARTGDDQRLKNLLSEAAEFDLQQRGFTTLTEAEWQKTRQAAGDQTVNPATPPDLFAQFTIKAVYAENGKDLTISFDWQNKNKNNGTYSKTSQLNDNLLYLDKLISDTITEITTKLGIKNPVSNNNSSKTNNQGKKETDKDPTRQQTDKFDQYANLKLNPQDTMEQTIEQKDKSQSALPDTKSDIQEQQNNSPTQPDKNSLKIFEISLGASPFVPAGELTRITQLGLFGSFTANYLVNFGYQAELALGLYGAVNYFQSTETVIPVPIMYIPLGLDLRYIMHSYLPFDFYIRASGGPAINMLFFEGLAPVNRLIMYALGGIGLVFNINSTVGLGIDSNFIIFFEPTKPVMGFHPSANIFYRL